MSSSLHGGGVPFVSDLTIDRILELQDELEFLEFFALEILKDGVATLKLREKKSDVDDGRSIFEIELDAAGRELLRLSGRDGGSGGTVVRGTSHSAPVPTTVPRIYLRLVERSEDFEPLDENLIIKLANNMRETGGALNSSTTPAIYTYFGQFLAHELTHMVFTGTPGSEFNQRTPAVDLDSVFDSLPEGLEVFGATECFPLAQPHHVCLGPTSAGRFEDIPRSLTGYPRITDARNDNNLAIAQLFVAITKFIARLQEINNFATLQELKIEASRYIQSILIHDYLPRICEAAVLQDIVAQGRRVIVPGPIHLAVPSTLMLTTEFSTACFRFGHSMVNTDYPWNDTHDEASLRKLLQHTHLGSGNDPNPNRRLIDDWAVDWSRFHGPNAFAKRIDTRVNRRLKELDPAWIDTNSGLPPSDTYDISLITLQRANQLHLANAQQVIEHLQGHGVVIPPSPLSAEIFPSGHPICTGLSDAERSTLNSSTPLWLYVLREAEVSLTGQLGPVGGRIVAETLYASITPAENNILTEASLDVPAQLGAAAADRFTLGELLIAGGST